MPTPMKPIVYRGGVANFRIPAHWQEEYSDTDGGMFYEDDPDAGTMRVSIITLEMPIELHPGRATDILQVVVSGLQKTGIKGSVKVRADGNAVFRYDVTERERGHSITILYWVIANPIRPSHARVITFSYTILSSRRHLESTRSEIEMLEAEIDAATFAEELGALEP